MSATASPSLAVGLRAGGELALARLRHRSLPGIVLVSLCLALTAGLVERAFASTGAADRALAAAFGWILPLATLALFTRVALRERLSEATWPVARFGLPRAPVVVGLVVVAGLFAALLGALLGAAAVLSASAGHAPALLDALVSARIGATAALAYTGLFALGSTALRRGGGRSWLFVLDLLLGGTGTVGVVLPRGHVEGLLGGASPLHFPQIASSGMLLALALVFTALAVFRSR